MNLNCPQPVEEIIVQRSTGFQVTTSLLETQKIAIADYQFCFDDNTLLFENQRISVQPKVMELVKLLVEQQGKIVTREKIETTLWPKAIVGLDSVNNTIARLRRLLNDNPKNPKYIETIPRIGYRLIKQSLPQESNVFSMPARWLQIRHLGLALSLTLFAMAIGSLNFHYKQVPAEHMTLHRSPEFQKKMLAKNMTVNELLEQYDIILENKKKQTIKD